MKRMIVVVSMFLMAAGALGGRMNESSSSTEESKQFSSKPSIVTDLSMKPSRPIRLQGGDNVSDATVITSFPAYYTGTTVGYTNDYDEMCPFEGFAPDVVYSFNPGASLPVRITLCQSSYDTKVYVYEDSAYNLIACNDDYCGPDGYKSEIPELFLNGGTTYYIVIDGYMHEAGEYVFELTYPPTPPPPCILECPPAAIMEDEPICYDNFEDIYNVGCSAEIWDTIPANVTVCGTSGTYIDQGSQSRDADWFEFELGFESDVILEGAAEFPYLLLIIRQGIPEPCYFEIVSWATALPCSSAAIDMILPAAKYWVWAGSTEFEGVPCGSLYFFTLTSQHSAACDYAPGDINGNGQANGIDVTYGVSYLKGGNAPPDSCDCPPLAFPFYASMDVNGNCAANGIDITYFVSYLKGQQQAPLFCADCPPGGSSSAISRQIEGREAPDKAISEPIKEEKPIAPIHRPVLKSRGKTKASD